MTARTKLKRALKSIEDAKSNLTTAGCSAEHAQHYARLAKSELQDATSQIQGALREISENE